MKEIELDKCDFCGEMFPADEADYEMSEHDYCVCPNCVDAAREQLVLSGEIDNKHDEKEFDQWWWETVYKGN